MKLWDGRFAGRTDRLMDTFNNSLPVDHALIEQDIRGSMAWAKALHAARVLTEDELGDIVAGLDQIRNEYRGGTLELLPTDEDIHMAVERILIDKIGDTGAKLHTGRSRNDQVATDFRLFVKDSLQALSELATDVQRALIGRAERDMAVIAPGYTHLQQAQPVLLAHYWLSCVFALEREKRRLGGATRAADSCPLGSGALAGSGFAVDRELLARELGFATVSENSMDAVASRDFALETLACCCSLGVLVSRYAEDLIIWSSREFGFVELDDAWSTGSSMMPQKKNPDSLELIRGKAGRFVGNYTRLATTLKGVGLTYYKDLQEDKEPVFDSLHQIGLVLRVFARVVETLTVRAERITSDLDSFLWATDMADYLVGKGVPFREAHRVVGAVVRHCIDSGELLEEVPLVKLRELSAAFGTDVSAVFSWQQALAHRGVAGGTSPRSVARQLEQAKAMVRGDSSS